MKKIHLKLPLSLALLCVASLAVTTVMFMIQPNTGLRVWPLIAASHGLTFLLNWLPVLTAMLLLFFISGNLVAACWITGLVAVILSVVNRYMVAMRWAPFRPFDLRLGMEFLGIAKSIKPAVFIAAGSVVVVFALTFATGLWLVRNTKPRILVRLGGGLTCAVVMVVLYFTVYANQHINAALPYEGSAYNDTDMYQSKGFLYSFLYDWNTSRIEKPPHYDQYKPTIEAAEAENATFTATPAVRPHIIMMLSESFSEMPLSPVINFDGYNDPLQYYKQIKESAFAGYIVAPHIGGGTSDTEFDILTGLNTRDFRGVPYTFTLVTRPFPGFTAALKSLGYAAMGLHPGAGWFYNRQNVYPLLGFDAFMDDATYDTSDTKGLYITERQTIDRIIADFQAHIDSDTDAPFFLDSITIQNHGPYNGKYQIDGTNFNASVSLTADETEALSHYFEGMSDCDLGLRRLTDYLETVVEPTVLVYYGDHLPSFPPAVYQKLITEPADAPPGESLILYNRLPFLIWTNEAARAYVDFSALESSLPADRTISAYYLGASVLELLGYTGVDPMMDYLNEMRGDYPVVLEQTWRGSDGVTQVYDPDNDTALALYRSWEYYRVTER